jgi:preprotein translocase subunit SecG
LKFINKILILESLKIYNKSRNIMFGLLVTVEILVSVLLMIAVLMQSSKGGGLAGSFGGASMGTVFGVRRTADFLSRATTILATVFILLSLITNIFFLPGKQATSESVIQRGSTPTAVPRALPPSSQQAPAKDQGSK